MLDASGLRNSQFGNVTPWRLAKSAIACGVSKGRLNPMVITLKLPAPSAR